MAPSVYYPARVVTGMRSGSSLPHSHLLHQLAIALLAANLIQQRIVIHAICAAKTVSDCLLQGIQRALRHALRRTSDGERVPRVRVLRTHQDGDLGVPRGFGVLL